MADTKIEWSDAVWNPTRGCTVVSPGCTNCYAMKQAHRFSGPGGPYEGLTKLTNGGPVWTGGIRVVPELLDAPLRWRRPRMVFVDSMSDLFHPLIADEYIDKVFAVMALAPQHTFQVLTKRPERMLAWFRRPRSRAAIAECVAELYVDHPEIARRWPFDAQRALDVANADWPLKNVWLGVSVEDQKRADERIPLLLDTPAAVRWLSCEPFLGPVNLRRLTLVPQRGPIGKRDPAGGVYMAGVHLDGLTGKFLESGVDYGARVDWVVVGGESGPKSRPMDPEWVLDLRKQCDAAGVPFFMKQGSAANWPSYKDFDSFPLALQVREYPA